MNLLVESADDGAEVVDDSQSNSSKSEDLDNSLLQEAYEQDSILDSVSNGDDDKSDSFEVESAWSEVDRLFNQDIEDLEDELTLVNEQNPPSRQVNIREIVVKANQEKVIAREIVK